MPEDNRAGRRRSIRLKGYDYTHPGGYFVTICTHLRKCLFGDIYEGKVVLNTFGEVVMEEWKRSSEIRHNIALDEFVIMPNHIHGIIFMEKPWDHGLGATGRSPLLIPARGPQKFSLASFISNYKASATLRIRKTAFTSNLLVWQRNYYEHVIRNETDLEEIREYIRNNPLKWLEDENHPDHIRESRT